ncbi:MAG: carbohydrate ABC transporter permease [Anaerolineales bacterium]|nr:carbohydrate ABC transporter permease [Anaerolineales bacterium]
MANSISIPKLDLKNDRVLIFLRSFIGKFSIYTFLILGVVISITPFVWMVLTSLMTLGEAQGIRWIPTELHFENYVEAWQEATFSEYFTNSVIITLITLSGELTFCILAAYAFARIKFPGRDAIFALLLSTIMIPAMVSIIPNFLTVTWLGRIGPIKWINNWPSLTVPFMGSIFAIFLLRQFFTQIPNELYDAARIDGAGHLRFLWTVVLPLSKAPLMVIIVLSFIGSWNSLAWPMLVTNSPEWRPIALGLVQFVEEAGQRLNLMMAGAFITIIPILVIYFITQKQFTESIARSGLKG